MLSIIKISKIKYKKIFIIKNTHYTDIFNSYKIHDILDIITENFLCLKVLKLDNFRYIVGKNIYIEDLSKNKINIFRALCFKRVFHTMIFKTFLSFSFLDISHVRKCPFSET